MEEMGDLIQPNKLINQSLISQDKSRFDSFFLNFQEQENSSIDWKHKQQVKLKFNNFPEVMHLDRDFVGELTPLSCRNGPIRQQTCTDFTCCIVYIGLTATVLFFTILSVGGVKMTTQEILESTKQTHLGQSHHAIIEAVIPIILALGMVTVICMLLVITSMTIPAITTFVIIPFMLFLMLFIGVVFVLRYFGVVLPLIHPGFQENFANAWESDTLITGIGGLVGFIGATITMILKRAKFSHVYPALRIAKITFWPNCHIFVFAWLFSLLSLSTLLANVALLSICLSNNSHLVHKNFTSILIVVEAFWTHGFIEALSDFFFQSISIHWYYKSRRISLKQQKRCDSLSLTLKMIGKHIGTISFGSVLGLVPETLNIYIGRIEAQSAFFYMIFCGWHKCLVRQFSKYSFFQTILQSLPFLEANKEMFGLRQRAKKVIPQIYMSGNFYITLCKTCCVIIGLILCYFFIGNSHLSYIFGSLKALFGPLVIVFFGSLEISNHFLNLSGLVADTVIFLYFADIEIEKKDFGDTDPFTCPNNVRDIIYEVKAGRTYIYD